MTFFNMASLLPALPHRVPLHSDFSLPQTMSMNLALAKCPTLNSRCLYPHREHG